jgi:iron complex outermembrane receptor protein
LIEPLQGKELVETPDLMVGGRINYELGDFVFGIQGKYTSKRWMTDLNDLSVAGYTVWDIDARWKLDKIHPGSFLQLNVQNLFSARYYGSLVGTEPTANTASAFYSGQPYAAQGTPRTLWVTFRQTF